MPDHPHISEAAKILSQLNACMPDSESLTRAQRTLAEALERAERRGREQIARQKESSG
jgi:hypothetical protein